MNNILVGSCRFGVRRPLILCSLLALVACDGESRRATSSDGFDRLKSEKQEERRRSQEKRVSEELDRQYREEQERAERIAVDFDRIEKRESQVMDLRWLKEMLELRPLEMSPPNCDLYDRTDVFVDRLSSVPRAFRRLHEIRVGEQFFRSEPRTALDIIENSFQEWQMEDDQTLGVSTGVLREVQLENHLNGVQDLLDTEERTLQNLLEELRINQIEQSVDAENEMLVQQSKELSEAIRKSEEFLGELVAFNARIAGELNELRRRMEPIEEEFGRRVSAYQNLLKRWSNPITWGSRSLVRSGLSELAEFRVENLVIEGGVDSMGEPRLSGLVYLNLREDQIGFNWESAFSIRAIEGYQLIRSGAFVIGHEGQFLLEPVSDELRFFSDTKDLLEESQIDRGLELRMDFRIVENLSGSGYRIWIREKNPSYRTARFCTHEGASILWGHEPR